MNMTTAPLHRALISVSDKTDLIDFAQALATAGSPTVDRRYRPRPA